MVLLSSGFDVPPRFANHLVGRYSSAASPLRILRLRDRSCQQNQTRGA
jgi:hypothetical protein